MMNILSVFIGGGLGCVTRYITSLTLKGHSFPFSTFIVNIVGCFILGFVFSYILKNPTHPSLKLALTIGFCGGLTTFSTFSVEGFEMLKGGRYVLFFIYTLLSFLCGLISVAMGAFLAKNV